jgi:hypothetical protein
LSRQACLDDDLPSSTPKLDDHLALAGGRGLMTGNKCPNDSLIRLCMLSSLCRAASCCIR